MKFELSHSWGKLSRIRRAFPEPHWGVDVQWFADNRTLVGKAEFAIGHGNALLSSWGFLRSHELRDWDTAQGAKIYIGGIEPDGLGQTTLFSEAVFPPASMVESALQSAGYDPLTAAVAACEFQDNAETVIPAIVWFLTRLAERAKAKSDSVSSYSDLRFTHRALDEWQRRGLSLTPVDFAASAV